ncbi:MAG: YihY/virulence factor BrkB family protein [Acidobacteriaceae bacterium]
MRGSHHNQSMDFVKRLARKFMSDRVLDGAAVLAFFFMLAVFPAAIFILSLLPYFSIPHLQKAILDLLHQVLPEQAANLFEGTIRNVHSDSNQGLLTFGLLFTIWSGSAGFFALMDQINIIREVQVRRSFWEERGDAILLMLVFAIIMIGSLSLVIFGGAAQSWVASLIGWSQPMRLFFATLRWIIFAAGLLLFIAVAYSFGPDVKVRFRFLSAGNLVAAALIALASIGFRFYVAEFGDYSATYGSLAAIIILMLWMYLAGIALLVGCEIDTLLHPFQPGQSDERE